MRPTRALLVQAAQLTGYPVKAAWSGHNKGLMGDVFGVVEHHTGTYVNYQRLDDYPTLRVVRDGRTGLVNSLSAYGLGRSGTIYCISEKLSWHAGTAWWGGTSDVNGHYLGIEAESDGTYWSDAQEDAYPRLVAAILHVFRRGTGDHPRHAEVARPRGRKTDWAGLNDADFDRKVRGYLAKPASINRYWPPVGTATPTAPKQEDISIMDAPTRTYLDGKFAALTAAVAAGDRSLAMRADQLVDKVNRTAAAEAERFAALTGAIGAVPELDATWFVQVNGRPEVYEVVEGRARHVSGSEWTLRRLRGRVTPTSVQPGDPVLAQLGIPAGEQDPKTPTTPEA